MTSWNEIRKPQYLATIKPLPPHLRAYVMAAKRKRGKGYQRELNKRLAAIRAARPDCVWALLEARKL